MVEVVSCIDEEQSFHSGVDCAAELGVFVDKHSITNFIFYKYSGL